MAGWDRPAGAYNSPDTFRPESVGLEPWRRHDEEDRLRSGIARPRESRFDSDDRQRDIWGKIYAYPVDELPMTRGFESSLWERSDAGVGGLAVRGAPPPATRVRESTRAFAQFEYRIVPTPLGEREFLPEISERRP